MPPKRPRRTSPATQGLSAGERLKRAKLSGYDRFAWTWVGTEVNNAAHITQEHRLATCGFNDSSAFQFCANKYRESVAKQEKTETKVAGGLDDDMIVVSDDETPACNVKNCRGNPHCLNYLGQEKWENEGLSLPATCGAHSEGVTRESADGLLESYRIRSRSE